MNARPLALALGFLAGLAPLAGRSDAPPPASATATPAPAKATAPAAAPPPAPAAKDATGPVPGKPSDAARSTPQHFEPTEKTRADFAVSFPDDI
jgi:hypothetical protein